MPLDRMPATRALLGAAALALAPSALAASYDPDLTWRTITTEHFDIHFHQGEEQLADEFSTLVERVYGEMTQELRWEPRERTQLVLVDRTDSANGYAQALPYNTIVIFVTAPTEDSNLAFYEDWSETVFTHELTHILHLDSNHGLVRLARTVVGRVASTNSLSPGWIVEGMGTFQETRHTSGGRGRSALAEMVLRTSVLDGEFPPLGNMDGYQVAPPGGNLRYLFGQSLMQYVSDTRGRDAWTRWAHTYGSGLPFLLPAKRVFGASFVSLYEEWRDHLGEKFAAQAEEIGREGLREGRLVSPGDMTCAAPSFAPDGEKLVWSCVDLKRGSQIWMAAGDGSAAEVLLQDRGASDFTWRRDSGAFAYAASHIVNRFNTWSDVYLLDLDKETPVALTNGARARDPEFSPDGSRLLVVTNRAQNNDLEVLTVDRRREKLTENTDHTQLSTPAFAPDGRVVALSVWKDGRRDLWLYSPEGLPLRRLTADAAPDRDPVWAADGRWLFFSSDRSGVPNIYAIETGTERLFQVTNVTTGATAPSVHPSGRLLAFQRYSADGWDVHVLDLDPASFIDRGLLPRIPGSDTPIRELTAPVDRPVAAIDASWIPDDVETTRPKGGPVDPFPALAWRQDSDSIDTFEQSEVEDAFGAEQDYPFQIAPHRYNPLPGLAPRFWLPYVQSTPYASEGPFSAWPFGGILVTGATAGTDPLRHYAYSASLSYRTDALYLGWSGAFTVNRFLPVFSVGASSQAVPVGRLPVLGFPEVRRDGSPNVQAGGRYWERRTTGQLVVSYPYSPRTTVFGSYRFTEKTNLRDLPEEVVTERLPTRGTIGEIAGGWRYAWSEPTPYAISTEDGRIFSLVGSFLHPWLGTRIRDTDGELQPLTQARLTTEIREYVTNPWVPNHVLAARAAAGVTVGDTSNFGTYQLGGNFGEGAFYATPDEFRMLRGYPVAADIGDRYWLGGLEYRFPIWRIERGVGTIPAYLRWVSGNVFVDAGNAFGDVQTWTDAVDGTLVGLGAELRVSTALGWGGGVTGRFGYATGLTEGGYGPTDPRTLYFQVGGSF